jgi:hypothetical protein
LNIISGNYLFNRNISGGDKWEMKRSLDPAIGQVPVEGYDEDNVFLNMIK